MAKLAKKTILGAEIKKYQFSKTKVPRLYREQIFGWLWLDNGDRIQIEYGKYYIVNKKGERTGYVLSSNPAHKMIKRMIARWFTTYRKGERGGQMHRAGYWRSRVIDGLHNCDIFRNSNVSFKNNQTTFLKLAS